MELKSWFSTAVVESYVDSLEIIYMEKACSMWTDEIRILASIALSIRTIRLCYIR